MGSVSQGLVVLQGGASPVMFGSIGRFSFGVASPVFVFNFELVVRPISLIVFFAFDLLVWRFPPLYIGLTGLALYLY